MTGTITVYFNTGFNGIDIPASAAVLQSASKKTYSDVYYMREDIDKPQIRIKDTYENLCAVDYCSITTSRGTSYYFASPAALTKGVTLLSLDLDALLTMGGAPNLTYISGWQERGHIAKSDDTLFGNVAAEEWVPSEPLEATGTTTLIPSTSVQNDYDIIISNIDMSALGQDHTADVQSVIEGVDSNDDVVMYFPSIKAPSVKTSFTLWDYIANATHGYSIPATCAYNANNQTVREGLQKLYSCGQLQLQASYKIPKEYLDNTPTESGNTGYISNINGVHVTTGLTGMPFLYSQSGYTPKNKKVFATYRNYTLVNIGSGDMITKKPEELYDGQLTYPSVNIWADPTSTGKPYARFAYIKGSPLQWFDNVKGLQWANSQMVMEGASGSMWNSINTAFANQQLEWSKAMNGYQSAMATAHNKLSVAQEELNYSVASGKQQIQGARQLAGFDIFGAGNTTIDAIATNASHQYNMENLRLNEEMQKNQADYANTKIQAEINQNAIGLLRSNNVVAPTISFTPEQNLGLYGYNYFVVYQTVKSYNDLVSEDMYYQRYGYNGLHRPLTGQCFNERDYYSYVQAYDVNLKGASEFGLRVRTKAIAQLNRGVRVWKVLPDASYYETN